MLRCVILLFGILVASAARADDDVLNVYGWLDYYDAAAIDGFTAETGIKVRYETYSSQTMLEATEIPGNSEHDIVMPTNEPSLSRLVEAGVLLPIDRSLVPNWRNLDPSLMAMVSSSDPGNRHGAIFLWGTFGIGLLPERIKALAPDAPLDSLALIFDPRIARRLEPCGIAVLDSPAFIFPAALTYLHLPPDTDKVADLEAAYRMMADIRPYIQAFTRTSAIDILAEGNGCVARAASGNVMQAALRAKNVAIRYVIPKEGTRAFFDFLAIPANAPHKAAAHAFINYMLRPEVIAGVTNKTRYANAVPASHPMVDPTLLSDPNIFLPPEQLRSLVLAKKRTLNARMTQNKLWIRLKGER